MCIKSTLTSYSSRPSEVRPILGEDYVRLTPVLLYCVALRSYPTKQRYIDEIQCAAGRVVEQIRARVRQRNPSNTRGDFDSIHVRRGDFQYKVTRFDPPDIIEMLQKKLVNGTTLFIATGELLEGVEEGERRRR